MSPRLRCAIYTRKSSEEGLEQNFNSLHAQREACEAYVLSQAGEGWSAIQTEYDDGGYSGGSMERPGLKQLLADIQRGLIDVVVVYKVDRLTRSLADFAKIVELFDAKGVSFVSVTQAFNTTSSMGRLTLNVLLSFAQFEREVTGERIRDKIAASKAKGLRMGGRPPLGYNILDGRLVVNADEAARVRRIFERYLELGSLSALQREGVDSKRWTNKAGEPAGGGRMSTGAITYLLSNPVYRGVNRHKDKTYEGAHPAIVDEETWNEAQALLAVRKAKHDGPTFSRRGKLAHILFDDRGNAMPVVHNRRRGKLYRYYLSRPKITGIGEPGSLVRISAGVLEQFLVERLAPLLSAGHAPDAEAIDRVVSALRRITLGEDQIVLEISETAVSPDALKAFQDAPDGTADVRTLRLAFHMRRRQGAVIIEPTDAAPTPAAKLDRALIRAVVFARTWAERLERGEVETIKALARAEGLCNHYTTRLLPLAYLAPDIVAQILQGRQPRAVSLGALTAAPLPADWEVQRRRFQQLGNITA